MISRRFITALTLATAACRAHDAPASSGAEPEKAATQAARAATLDRTIPADTDPCGWVDSSAVVRLLGPVVASPYRAHDASNAEQSAEGRACAYTLKRVESGATGSEVVLVEVMMKDAAAEQSAAESGLALAARVVGSRLDRSSTAASSSPPRTNGWDAIAWIPNEFVGRVGHVAVHMRLETRGAPFSRLSTDSVERLAVLVRDRIPDVPAAAPQSEWNSGSESDPCKLLTRAEVEGALGALSVPPYRSNGDTPLADPSGDGCSYYARMHHVLTIKPDWDSGRALFRMQAAATRALASPVGKTEQADTLEGAWDEAAAGMDGTLFFLKGDRMLTVAYRAAGLTEPAALRLAGLAIERLR